MKWFFWSLLYCKIIIIWFTIFLRYYYTFFLIFFLFLFFWFLKNWSLLLLGNFFNLLLFIIVHTLALFRLLQIYRIVIILCTILLIINHKTLFFNLFDLLFHTYWPLHSIILILLIILLPFFLLFCFLSLWFVDLIFYHM